MQDTNKKRTFGESPYYDLAYACRLAENFNNNFRSRKLSFLGAKEKNTVQKMLIKLKQFTIKNKEEDLS